MAEKQYEYTAKIRQPQTVAGVKLDPRGGNLSEREYKTVRKDAYGASLLEKGLLSVREVPSLSGDTGTVAEGNAEVPDFDTQAGKPAKNGRK
jgi:hypothetical protein